MTMFDGAEFGREVVASVKSYLSRELRPLRAELAALKERIELLEARQRADEADRKVRDARKSKPVVRVPATGRAHNGADA